MPGAQVPTLLSDLAETRGFSRPFFRFSNLLQQLTELREDSLPHSAFIMKDATLNSPVDETPAGGTGGAGGSPLRLPACQRLGVQQPVGHGHYADFHHVARLMTSLVIGD